MSGRPSKSYGGKTPRKTCIKPKKKKTNQRQSALRDIRKQQRSLKPNLSTALVSRKAKEVVGDLSANNDIRMTKGSILALQEIAEIYIVKLLEKANTAVLHRERVTVSKKDLDFVRRLTNE